MGHISPSRSVSSDPVRRLAPWRRRTDRRFRRGVSSAVVAALGILVLVWPTAAPASAATAVPADSAFVSLLNVQRTLRGQGPLTLDGELSSIARAWSMNMANAKSLSHNGALSSLSNQQGWAAYGENVAYGTVLENIVAQLVSSPVHAGNIFNGQFTRVGIGTVLDGKGQLWTTHVFMRPGGASTPTPTVAPTTRSATPTPVPTSKVAVPGSPTATGSNAASSGPATTAPAGGAPSGGGALPTPLGQVGGGGAARQPGQLAVAPLDAASSTRDDGVPLPLLAGGGLLLLLLLGGAGYLFYRSSLFSSY